MRMKVKEDWECKWRWKWKKIKNENEIRMKMRMKVKEDWECKWRWKWKKIKNENEIRVKMKMKKELECEKNKNDKIIRILIKWLNFFFNSNIFYFRAIYNPDINPKNLRIEQNVNIYFGLFGRM